jgi:20S proteasome alpha/beta subunit
MISPTHEAVSPLTREDGTDRFVQVTKSIVMGHSGINADGRVLCTAAQRLAVEHEYTFDEEIPMNIFLEEMSLLMQRYTMKPGSRPFGCSLMVGFSQSSSATNKKNQSGKIFTLDPSGAVHCWEDGIAFIGRDEGILQQKLKSIDVTSESVDEIIGIFMDDLIKVRNTAKYAPELGPKETKGVHLLLAFFHQKSALTVRKWSR